MRVNKYITFLLYPYHVPNEFVCIYESVIFNIKYFHVHRHISVSIKENIHKIPTVIAVKQILFSPQQKNIDSDRILLKVSKNIF